MSLFHPGHLGLMTFTEGQQKNLTCREMINSKENTKDKKTMFTFRAFALIKYFP